MSATTITRDYSLVGPEADKAVAAGLASAKWYTPPITRAELKELMRRDDGPAIRDTLIWIRRVHRVRGPRLLFLGDLGRGSLLSHLRRALRLFDRQPLARVRPSHRVQDAMDERRGLSDRLLHDHARADDLALEPYAPPHRYDHRRARSRDHHAASAGRCVASAQHLRAQEHGRLLSARCFCTRPAG